MEKLKMESVDMTQKNIERVGALFPNVITEMRDENGILRKGINFELLKQELSSEVIDKEECYDFTWVGKKAAIVEGNTPIRKTLRPCIEESKDWEDTGNLYIEGDNLDVLKLLQESYLNSIKVIYIDPPYNTGSDSFVYSDNYTIEKREFEEYIEYRDEEGKIQFKQNNQTNPRFHSDWCSMLYARLKLAVNLLTDDGIIFISIDDNEVANLRKICDEIFGVDNFIGLFIINSSPSAIDYGHIAKMHDYAIFYAKDLIKAITNQLPDKDKKFKYSDEIGNFNLYPLYNGNVAFNPKTRPNLYYPFYLNPLNELENGFFEIGLVKKDGWVEVYPVISRKDGIQRVWRWGKKKSLLDLNKEIVGYKNESGEFRIVQKTRLTGKVIRSLQIDKEISSRRGTSEVEKIFDNKIFSFPKPIELIKRFVCAGSGEKDVVLDLFSGSATTAHAVMQLNAEDNGNRKFIMVQLPEPCSEESESFKAGYNNICEIGKERIRRAGDKINEEIIDKNAQLEIGEDAKLPVDTGFRVLRVDSTNMKDVYYAANEYSQLMLAGLESNIKEDRTDLDLLYGVLLDWGLPLSLSHKIEEIDGVSVHTVDAGSLVACFADQVSEGVVREIAKRQPLRVVFRDSSFANSPDKINVKEIFKLHAPNTTVKVI